MGGESTRGGEGMRGGGGGGGAAAGGSGGQRQHSQQPQGRTHQIQQQQEQQQRRPPIRESARKRRRAAFDLKTDFELQGKVGEGTFGVVYVARPNPAAAVGAAKKGKASTGKGAHHPPPSSSHSHSLVALKEFKKATKEGDGVSPTAVREIMLLRELRHENIIRLCGVHLSHRDSTLFLSFEYAEHDLFEMIRFHRESMQPMALYTVKSVLWQLLAGMDYLHSNWIMHRDLKPANIMVMGAGPHAGEVKVADFGLARIFQSPLKPLSENGVVVTIWYRAPELLLGARHYTRAVDIWALGCIFGEMLALHPIFQAHEDKGPNAPFQVEQLMKICQVLGPLSTERWPALSHMPSWINDEKGVRRRMAGLTPLGLETTIANLSAVGTQLKSAEAKDLMMRMLEYDPTKRITAKEALAHPFFGEDPLPGKNCMQMKYPPRTRREV